MVARSAREHLAMRKLAILVACFSCAGYARRGHRVGEQVMNRRNQENPRNVAPASHSLAETDEQARFVPLKPWGRVSALPRPVGNAIQNRRHPSPPVMAVPWSKQWMGDESNVDADDRAIEKIFQIINRPIEFKGKTPTHFRGQRLPGRHKGTFLIQFTLPGKDDQPKNVFARPSTELDASFGAVKVKLPLDMEVTSNLVEGRLVVEKIRGESNAQTSGIQVGDIIRSISVPDGMMILDSKLPADYLAALNHNEESNGQNTEVVLLIERPVQERGDEPDAEASGT